MLNSKSEGGRDGGWDSDPIESNDNSDWTTPGASASPPIGGLTLSIVWELLSCDDVVELELRLFDSTSSLGVSEKAKLSKPGEEEVRSDLCFFGGSELLQVVWVLDSQDMSIEFKGSKR